MPPRSSASGSCIVMVSLHYDPHYTVLACVLHPLAIALTTESLTSSINRQRGPAERREFPVPLVRGRCRIVHLSPQNPAHPTPLTPSTPTLPCFIDLIRRTTMEMG